MTIKFGVCGLGAIFDGMHYVSPRRFEALTEWYVSSVREDPDAIKNAHPDTIVPLTYGATAAGPAKGTMEALRLAIEWRRSLRGSRIAFANACTHWGVPPLESRGKREFLKAQRVYSNILEIRTAVHHERNEAEYICGALQELKPRSILVIADALSVPCARLTWEQAAQKQLSDHQVRIHFDMFDSRHAIERNNRVWSRRTPGRWFAVNLLAHLVRRAIGI